MSLNCDPPWIYGPDYLLTEEDDLDFFDEGTTDDDEEELC